MLTCRPALGQTGATFDSQPLTSRWRAFRLAPPLSSTVYVGSTGAVTLDANGSTLEVCRAPSIQYAPGLVAAITTNAQEAVIDVTGTVAGAWAVQQAITIHTNGVTVRYAFQAQREGLLPPTLQGYTGDNFQWQRFVGESAGRPVWGYLMDLRGQDRVPMNRWMEVGPVREVLAAYEIGTNTTLTLQGWDETPATHHGFVTTRYQWTQTDPRPLATGEACRFELSVRLRPHSQPWQVKPETVTRVVAPREFDFLHTATHASGIEIEPEGVCAPVFGVDQPVRLRVSMRVANESAPLAMAFAVTNAATGQGVGQGECLAVRQNGTNQSLCAWQPPGPGVYNFLIRGHDGLVDRTRRYQVAVVGPIEQPAMVLGASLPLRLVDTIACGNINDPHPFWSSATNSRIVESPSGAYRETGAAAGSWMQYRIVVEPHRIYVVEVDYPDDDDRSTSVSITEPNDPSAATPWGVLRAASGYATGTVFPLTGKRETLRLVYFSGDTTWATVDVMNPSPMWKAGAVTAIRLYELEGELPRLNLPAGGGRSLALYTESGDVAFGSMYTGRHFRTNEDVLGNVPADNFYREWYGAAVNLVKYLRFTGQDGYVCGLYRYDSPRYPSQQYSHYAAPDVTVDYTALLAKLFEYNGLKLYPSVMTTRAWPGTVRHAHRTQYEVVTEGEHTAVNVGPDGQQDLRTFLAGVPALNPASPELRTELGNMAAEIAGRYASFTSVPGIFWIAGGAWQPFYTVQGGSVTEASALRYSYDDDTLARFFAEQGQPLPEDPHDPARFQKRYDYIMANLKQEWIAFRCKLLAECHDVIAGAMRQVRPDLVYYPCEINNVPSLVYRSGGAFYDRLKQHAMDPALHAGKDDRAYVHHRWDLALLKDGLSVGGMTPERMKSEVYPLHGRGLLDPELNAAYEQAAPRVGAFLQRQFQEYPFTQPTNALPGFYTPPARLAQDRWAIPCNIQYAQPAGWRWLHDYALMFARTTPELVTWMWCDGRIPVGHEAQIQYLSAFIRSLPLGRYETVAETASGVFARLLELQPGQARVLYLVNTSLEPQTVALQVRNNERLIDRVTGATLAGTNGVWTLSLERAALRAFTLGPTASDIRLKATFGSAAGGVVAWYPGRDYRQRITVNPAFVSGSGVHTNFPLLVTEDNVEPALWEHAQPNGGDIVFTADDGVTQIAHDLEQYDALNKRLCAWVRIPELAGETATVFYLYYGNPLAAAVQDGAVVCVVDRTAGYRREASEPPSDTTPIGATFSNRRQS